MAAPSAPQSSAEKRNFEDTGPFPVGFQIVHVGNGKVALTMPTSQIQMVTPKSVSIPTSSQISLANFVGTAALAAVPPDATLSAAASLSAIGAEHSKSSAIIAATTGSLQVTQSPQVVPAPPTVKKLAPLSIQTLDAPSLLTTSNKLLQHSPTNTTLVNHADLVEEMNGLSSRSSSDLSPPKASSMGGGGSNAPSSGRITLRTTTTPLSTAQDVLHRENDYPLQDPTLIQESVNSLPIFLQTSTHPITSSPQAILTNISGVGGPVGVGVGGSPLVQSVKGAGGPVTPNNTHEMQDGIKKREMRLYKNREAARECRRKKKEYLKCLENRVQLLENQNKSLIEELRLLKEHYQAKEQQQQQQQHQLYAISSTAAGATSRTGAPGQQAGGSSTPTGGCPPSDQMLESADAPGGGSTSGGAAPVIKTSLSSPPQHHTAVKNKVVLLSSSSNNTDLYSSNGSSQDNSASE